MFAGMARHSHDATLGASDQCVWGVSFALLEDSILDLRNGRIVNATLSRSTPTSR